jgi:methylenetetrahydrofolate reductase (NADPH)
LADFVQQAHVRGILLIAGDYAEARGPYATVSQVLQSGIIGRHGLARIAFAGHPEGHPKVASTELRRALLEKVQLATAANLEVRLVTQFFFDHSPFLRWAEETRAGVEARIVGGLAGPANLARHFKFALRCAHSGDGGQSIRA